MFEFELEFLTSKKIENECSSTWIQISIKKERKKAKRKKGNKGKKERVSKQKLLTADVTKAKMLLF